MVAGATEGVELPFGLTTVVKALEASGDNGFNWVYNNYYRKLERNLVDAACGEFFSGRIGPAEFLDQCQKGADSIAAGHARSRSTSGPRDSSTAGAPTGSGSGPSHGSPLIITFLVPPLLLYVVFVLSPYLQAFQISTTDWLGYSAEADPVGLANFGAAGTTTTCGTR